MEQIYWLTRLDTIGGISIAFAVIFGVLTLAAWIMHWTTADCDPTGSYECEIKFSDSVRWPSLITAVVSLLILIFTPSKKDLLMIYGIGETIDYIQENKTLQGIPDKCVKALDIWVDSWTKDNPKEKIKLRCTETQVPLEE